MQHSNKRYKSWLDILPEDIQTLIWKKVYNSSVEQISVFGSYKALIKCYLSRHLFNNNNNIKSIIVDNSDNFIQQNNDNRFYRWGENVKYYKIISQMLSPSSDWDCNNNYDDYCSAKKFYSDKFNTIKIFNKNIVDTLYKIYMLCRFVPDDWQKIGRWENLAATRYTKFIPES
jgi:hypothetical protein